MDKSYLNQSEQKWLRPPVQAILTISTSNDSHPTLAMATDFIKLIEATQLRDDIPEFEPGDTVNVHVRVVEGEKERIQQFQGTVIARKGEGARETFTVRKISNSVGVERVFPVYSPKLATIEVIRRGHVRRAKLYYLRDLRGKAARIREKRLDSR